MTPSSVLRLDDMSRGEARQLLRERTAEQALCGDETAVDELLELLTCLPLAIVQAAAFMSTNDVSVSDYLAMFRDVDAQAELFNEGFADPSRYEEQDSTIAKTWHISFDQIRKQDPLAAEYLSFMACVDRVSIPQSLLPHWASTVQVGVDHTVVVCTVCSLFPQMSVLRIFVDSTSFFRRYTMFVTFACAIHVPRPAIR